MMFRIPTTTACTSYVLVVHVRTAPCLLPFINTRCVYSVGILLAVGSGVLIGASFVFKKKGLIASQRQSTLLTAKLAGIGD